MLLTLLANLVMVEPVVPPVTDTADGYLPKEYKADEETKKREERIKNQNEEILIIVNSVMTCLN
jgi:hypothetical protein